MTTLRAAPLGVFTALLVLQSLGACVPPEVACTLEARASLALPRPLPGEDAPDRLPEVLQRLRVDAAAGLARRSAAMEIGARMT